MQSKSIRSFFDHSKPYVIAEIGVNHGGSLDLAKSQIELAANAGANAAKFQSYKANTLAAQKSPSYWDTSKEPCTSQFELFAKYDSFNESEYVELARHCRDCGIDFISTPFDSLSVEFLDPLMPFYKISSSDITNFPLLRQVASKFKPVVLSTGASYLWEIQAAVNQLSMHGASDISLLHCILNYPTDNDKANLRMIDSLSQAFPGHVIGYSDHTLPSPEMSTLLASYLLGARIIEKHFTHDKTLPGNDHYHAMDAADLKNFIFRLNSMDELLGSSSLKQPIKSEKISRRNARRSLVTSKTLPKDHIITYNDLIPKRPESGISASLIDDVVGSRLRRDVDCDHILQWSDVVES